MTEDEAKTKWCPFVRHPVNMPGYSNGNRFNKPSLDATCRCIGSRCMAWRWEILVADESMRNKNDRGCCGLAGK
jgi:hypothetical protein